MIELAAGRWRASLRPEVGGCIASLDRNGIPVLRTMPESSDDVLQSACFALLPYCNRIEHGTFTFAGRTVTIAPNMKPQRHPLHGTAWKRSWKVVRCDIRSALLEDDYAAGEWPWAYRAHQHIALNEGGCTVRLMVENRASEAAPIGLGLHPYFRRSGDSNVAFEATTMLGIDDEFLPDGSRWPANILASWDSGATLPDTLVDHCFTDWNGNATISDSRGSIRVQSFGAPVCHVFAPPQGEELCIEPVSHTPDALNRKPWEMTLLPPGAAAGIALRIEAGPPA
ncbi:aldose 1-epimerase [Porphyrobacter algicida]|uniref:Aldose 1-epimerase n=1 Tax=Qipengyuania algicida TaxID=1836209 RepID=A0A845ACQ5_9SPHN|nr:aldose 1-epimerase [Qipengyuania algicida]